ncbi:MAG: GNAT family N-acetyltransferase [Chitinophagaceae bacterium]|nr:GNAT family N-acetyltransferase [Chitinophagaceae bacterium]
MEIKQATEKEDFLNCWPVVKELRPHLSPEQYVEMVLQMLDETYQIVFIEEDGNAVSFCGFRYTTMFHRGKCIYIDDLCTLPSARGKGYAATLLNYVIEKAKAEEVQSVHLDSGHQRFDAHRLYLNRGFNITAHHFALTL